MVYFYFFPVGWRHVFMKANLVAPTSSAECNSSIPINMYAHAQEAEGSGVGTVAAVAALAATLFRPQINIHNLLS